jgi:type I restriction enzyme R subunit
MSQFAFLSDEFPEVFRHASKAEYLALSDPRSACFYARLSLEALVSWLYEHDGSLRDPYDETLSARMYEASFRRLVGNVVATKARIIKDYGEVAVHGTPNFMPDKAVVAVRELFHVAYWLTRTYGQGTKPSPLLVFVQEELPRTSRIAVATLNQLQDAARKFAKYSKARAEADRYRLADQMQRESVRAELVVLRAKVAATKASNTTALDTHDYEEATTRDTFIELLLQEAGWPLDKPQDRKFPVTGLPDSDFETFVDYVLWSEDGTPLGLVETNETRKDARAGQQQAKLYADYFEKQFGQRPVIFYTTGYEHWVWNDTQNSPRSVQGFLTNHELQLVIQRRSVRKPLIPEEIDTTIVADVYQIRAIRPVIEALENDHRRRALLFMAARSGKTRAMIALIDLLKRSNWLNRVLFLADREVLVRQAVDAFKQHLPTSKPVNLVSELDDHGWVYISTYTAMIKLIDETIDGKRLFGVGHFDLVVIDEAHPSVYRRYGAIFDYFDTLLIGLTAIPEDELDRHTYRFFGLQRNLLTDA